MSTVEVLFDGLRTNRGLNAREHWRARASRVLREKTFIDTRLSILFRGLMWGDPSSFRAAVGPPPYTVTITRISPRLADDDNVIGGLKSIRDELAAWLGTGDGPKAPVRWRYSQEQSIGGKWGVRARIEAQRADVEAAHSSLDAPNGPA